MDSGNLNFQILYLMKGAVSSTVSVERCMTFPDGVFSMNRAWQRKNVHSLFQTSVKLEIDFTVKCVSFIHPPIK